MDRETFLRLFIITFFPVFLTSCSNLLYLVKGAKYEILLLSHEKKISELIQRGDLPGDLREKLSLVLEVKRFAQQQGLTPGRSYEYYSDVKLRSAAYVLTAVKSLSWDVKTWWFPIVGRIPYLGFPSLKDAESYAEKLQDEGYDTDIGEATAFSTLGFLPDPVTPVMLERPAPLLAELILHESTHATIYFSGETQFDEHIAVYVENIGGIRFARIRWGPDSDEYKFLKNKWSDTLLFSSFLDEVKKGLDSTFAEKVDPSSKLEERKSFLEKKQNEFEKIAFKTDLFSSFSLLPPNNARLLQYLIYYQRISSMWKALNHSTNIKKIIDFFKKKPSGMDPWKWMEEWKNFPG